jgi:hypothetical protein
MLRHVIVIALVLYAGAAAALETPLTLITAQGNRVVVIDPSFGSISLYEVSQSSTNRMSGLRQPQANFIAEIESRLKSFITEQNGLPIQTLRLGQETRPSYADMFAKVLPQKPTVREANAGKKALCWRVRDSEDAFWKGELAYDGVVRAALSSSGQYLLLGIPSLHMLLLYQVDGEAIRLVGLRNYGPELFMTGMNTSPNPGQLLQEVMQRMPKERESEARAALGIEDEASPTTFAPPAVATEAPPTPKSDLWIGPGSRDTFLVIDTLNTCAMLYQAQGLILAAQRDLRIDLKVPGLVGGSLSSSPASEVLIKDFINQRKEYIVKYGLPTEREEILLLIGQRKPQGAPITFEALSDASSGLAMINFVDRHVFLTLEHMGGTALNLAAARDYTLDIAITLLDQEIQDRERAKALLASVAKLASSSMHKAAMLTLRQVLSLDPTLHKEAETKLKNAFKKDADQQAQFLALLDEAAKKTEALAKQAEERKKALEERRKKLKSP